MKLFSMGFDMMYVLNECQSLPGRNWSSNNIQYPCKTKKERQVSAIEVCSKMTKTSRSLIRLSAFQDLFDQMITSKTYSIIDKLQYTRIQGEASPYRRKTPIVRYYIWGGVRIDSSENGGQEETGLSPSWLWRLSRGTKKTSLPSFAGDGSWFSHVGDKSSTTEHIHSPQLYCWTCCAKSYTAHLRKIYRL